jgi:hypothetical protein
LRQQFLAAAGWRAALQHEHEGFRSFVESEAPLKEGINMKWIGEYIVDDAGQCRWHECLRIQDEHMKSAYRKNVLVEFIIETSAIMGVKVGIA